jgi:hypothetical protein
VLRSRPWGPGRVPSLTVGASHPLNQAVRAPSACDDVIVRPVDWFHRVGRRGVEHYRCEQR